ncbi:uncharacterized protein LODBEIA_P02410 [Lodderomyces beijingensis]|uniref:Exonuclease domain-containing protein n=1 Tax=Lodderomyces beijingensis TaxID=1775926 RepID=A0ABP0ZIL0_9ASCO
MTDSNTEEPLSTTTSRLSISQSTIEDDNTKVRARELLIEEVSFDKERRNSAVSLNSFVEEDNGNDPLQQSQQSQSQSANLILPKKSRHEKRRRSSNHSLVSGIGAQQPPQKREKIHKRKLKAMLASPSLTLFLEEEKESTRFQFRNVRSLILQLFKVPGSGNQVKWCKVENPNEVKCVCVCFAPGCEFEDDKIRNSHSRLISNEQLNNTRDEFPFIYNNFATVVKSILPGGKDSVFPPLDALINIRLTKAEKKAVLDRSKQEKITINDLLLPSDSFEQFNYPTAKEDETWRETHPASSPGSQSRIFALDCEFCKANDVSVLTRISLVDFDGDVVFDELVKPTEEITDYVTRYSGITEELLKDVVTTISDAQDLFLRHVHSEDILVGHSLESDLRVMKILHKKIVDTSIIYEHNRGPPSKPSLRWLAKTFLDRDIQTGEDNGQGHSSVEDANSCLDLVKLKILEGRCFGTNVDEISVFERLKTANKDHQSILVSYGKTQALAHCFADRKPVTNDDEVVDFIEQTKIVEPSFVVTELRDLQYNLKWASPSEHYDGIVDYNVAAARQRTNDRIQRIYNQLPENSLFILCSQSGSPSEMYKLQHIRRSFQKMEKEGVLNLDTLPKEESWDQDKLDSLIAATSTAREGLTFLKIKEATNQPDSTQP